MQAIRDYLDQLTKKDKLLLFFSLGLLSLVFFKFFLIDPMKKTNINLKAEQVRLQEQKSILDTIKNKPISNITASTPANKVVTNFLKQNSISQKLKQIRTTSKGEQRFELEDIEFSKGVELLGLLDKNGTKYSSVQIKDRKKPGLVNLVIVIVA